MHKSMDKDLNKELNEKIKLLFYRMIKSWDRITTIEGGYIHFDNGLLLTAFGKHSKEEIEENEVISLDEGVFSSPFALSSWDVVTPDTDKLIFYIVTPFRQYTVPEITNRSEYAKTLDILEDSLRKFEKKMLSKYLDYFNYFDESNPDREIDY